jgi:hypothetical protein
MVPGSREARSGSLQSFSSEVDTLDDSATKMVSAVARQGDNEGFYLLGYRKQR